MRRGLGAVLLLGAASACQFFAPPTALPTHIAAEIPESSLTLLDTGNLAPPPKPLPKAVPEVVPKVAPKVVPKAATPRNAPGNSMGWKRAELTKIFGEADYIRQDGVGEVHQYRLEHCIIDFTLYPVGAQLEVIAWHGRSRQQTQDIDSDACTSDLENRRPVP